MKLYFSHRFSLYTGISLFLILISAAFFIWKAPFFKADTIESCTSQNQATVCNDSDRRTYDFCQVDKKDATNNVCMHRMRAPKVCYGKQKNTYSDTLNTKFDLFAKTAETTDDKIKTAAVIGKKGTLSECASAVGKNGYYGDIDKNGVDGCKDIIKARAKDLINSGYNKISFDEYGFYLHVPYFYKSVAKAFLEIKKEYPKVTIITYAVAELPSNTFFKADDSIIENEKEAFVEISKNSDYLALEVYFNDENYCDSNDLGNTGICNNGYDLKSAFENLRSTYKDFYFSKTGRNLDQKIVYVLAVSDYVNLTYDRNPQVNFGQYLNNEIKIIKNIIADQPSVAVGGGIGFYNCVSINEENTDLLSKFMDHYFTRGLNDLYPLSQTIANQFIENSGFQDNGGWTFVNSSANASSAIVSASNFGLITSDRSFEGLPIYRNSNATSKMTKVPEGKENLVVSHYFQGDDSVKVLEMTHGSGGTKAKQRISNLVPGKKYRLEVFSKKVAGDFSTAQNSVSSVKTDIVKSSNNSSINPTYKKEHYYSQVDIIKMNNLSDSFIDSNDANLSSKLDNFLARCQSLNSLCNNQSYLWSRETIDFVAPNFDLDLVISDSVSGQNISADTKNIIDFVQLQEYTLSM